MSQSSHGEAPVFLGPKAGKPVQKPGDFIFLREAAFPVRVIVDGDPVTMEAGEKRRFDRSLDSPDMPAFDTFEIENTSENAQRVVFVVGTGDYEKIIVSGEMNVTDYVSTTNGESLSLPMDLTRRVGVVSLGEADHDPAVILQSEPGQEATSEYTGVVYWNDDVYHITTLGKYRYTLADGVLTYQDFTAWVVPVPSDDGGNARVAGAGVTPTGELFFFADNTELFRSHMDSNEAVGTGVYGLNSGFATSDAAMGYLEGGMWYWVDGDYAQENTGAFIRIDVESLFREVIDVGGGYDFTGAAGVTAYIDALNGELAVATGGAGQSRRYTTAGEYVRTVNGASHREGLAYSPDGVYTVATHNGDLELRHAQDRTVYGELWVQDGADAATRRQVYLTVPRLSYQRNGGQVLVGGVVEAMLRAYDYDTSDYLNYLTAVEFNNGLLPIKYGSGTESFALRGMNDGFPYWLKDVEGSDVTISILPEFFEQ